MSATTSKPRFSVKYSARDLINVAIFAVIYIVVTYAIGMVGLLSPIIWLLIIPVQVIANGIPFMLFLTRVKHFGMIALWSIIIALFYMMTGNTPFSTILIVVLGVAADLIMYLGKYLSKWAAIWAYAVVSLSMLTPFLPLLWNRAGYFETSAWAGVDEEYIQTASSILTTPVVGLIALGLLVSGLLGGLLGSKLLNKHFKKAGLA